MRRWWPVLCAALLLGAAPAVAEDAGAGTAEAERVAGPLPRFFPHLDSYLELPEDARSHFRLSYRVQSEQGIPPEDIRMWYEHAGETREFDLDSMGRISRLPGPEALDARPDVWINQPPGGGFSLSMQFEYPRPAASHYRAGDLETGIRQANRAIRQAAGVAALFAPRMETVIFVFDGAAPDAWAVSDDGHRTPLTVQENRVLYRPGDRDNRSIERLEFGREPRRIVFDS